MLRGAPGASGRQAAGHRALESDSLLFMFSYTYLRKAMLAQKRAKASIAPAIALDKLVRFPWKPPEASMETIGSSSALGAAAMGLMPSRSKHL